MRVCSINDLLRFSIFQWYMLGNGLQFEYILRLEGKFRFDVLIGEYPILLLFKSQPNSKAEITQSRQFIEWNTESLKMLMLFAQFETVASLSNFLHGFPNFGRLDV